MVIGILAIFTNLVSMSQFLNAFIFFNVLMIEITSSVVDGEKKIELFTPICGVVYDETLSTESIFSAFQHRH